MKPLQRIAIVVGAAQVAVLVTASRRHAPSGARSDRAGRRCNPPPGPRGRGRPGRHHPSHHGQHGQHGQHGRDDHGPEHHGHRGPGGGGPGGPPPWMRDRLEAWHRAQHTETATEADSSTAPDVDE